MAIAINNIFGTETHRLYLVATHQVEAIVAVPVAIEDDVAISAIQSYYGDCGTPIGQCVTPISWEEVDNSYGYIGGITDYLGIEYDPERAYIMEVVDDGDFQYPSGRQPRLFRRDYYTILDSVGQPFTVEWNPETQRYHWNGDPSYAGYSRRECLDRLA